MLEHRRAIVFVCVLGQVDQLGRIREEPGKPSYWHVPKNDAPGIAKTRCFSLPRTARTLTPSPSPSRPNTSRSAFCSTDFIPIRIDNSRESLLMTTADFSIS